MIKVHFFDRMKDVLDVEHELDCGSDVADFLTENVPGIQFEATDNQADLDDNWIYWFSAEDVSMAIEDISNVLSSIIKFGSTMDFTVTAEDW
jgi:hypothetical protein